MIKNEIERSDLIISIVDFRNDLTEIQKKVKLNTIEYEDLVIFHEKYKRYFRANNYNISDNPLLYELLGCGYLLLEEKSKKFRRF
jgi:hypothetical protein